MVELPILFSGAFSGQVHHGEKTQTRRPVKPMRGLQSSWLTPELLDVAVDGGMTPDAGCGFGWQMKHPRGGSLGWVRSPYGRPGDRLWVREAWRPEERESDSVDGIRYLSDEMFIPIDNTMEAANAWVYVNDSPKRGQNRPSIHMPRWACRTVLDVLDIRVERVQSILDTDVLAEGIRDDGSYDRYNLTRGAGERAYRPVWDATYGQGSWERNAWVWVVTFRVAWVRGSVATYHG